MKPSAPWRVLGIMSGTSLDRVDYALCACKDREIRLLRAWSAPFPVSLRSRLHAAAANQASSHEVGQFHHDLGRLYVQGARRGLRGEQLDAIGLHGQTIFHQPDGPTPATLQLGEPAWLTEALRVPVVSNFRAADLAAGGQGAPLATLFHRVVFAQRGAFVCVNNLGGISNVTALDWRRGREPRVLAFDTGPANMLLDLAARHFSHGRRPFDRHGVWASRGTPDEALLDAWLRHPYFRRRPPKSTGRERFGEPFWDEARTACRQRRLPKEDVLATLAEFTARSILLNYQWHLGGVPDRVILAGGGAANQDLAGRIARHVQTWNPDVRFSNCASLGWPEQAVEPAAFALLAYYRLRAWPGNLPATTGARRPVLLGQVTGG